MPSPAILTPSIFASAPEKPAPAPLQVCSTELFLTSEYVGPRPRQTIFVEGTPCLFRSAISFFTLSSVHGALGSGHLHTFTAPSFEHPVERMTTDAFFKSLQLLLICWSTCISF